MPRFSFRRAAEPGVQQAMIALERKPFGEVKSVPGGWAYRTEAGEPWTYGAELKHEAATAMYAVVSMEKDSN